MALLKKEDVTPKRPVIIVIYGSPGVGKTSVINTADNPVLIDCDRGFDRAAKRVDTIVASKWDDVLSDESELKEYKTVCIDTAKAVLDDYLSVWVCDQDYKLRKNKLKMYGEIGEQFKAFVNRRRAENVDIIVCAHTKEEKDGDIIKISPDVTGQSKDLLLRIADQVGFMSIVNGKRIISFDPTDTSIGKNVARIPPIEVPDVNDPKFDTFMSDIVNLVKDSIQCKSEEQKKAIEKISEINKRIEELSEPGQADELLAEINTLTKIQSIPLKHALNDRCKDLSFVFDKQTNLFKNETA